MPDNPKAPDQTTMQRTRQAGDFAQAVTGCADDDMPTERVQDLNNTLALRFLDSVFADGEMPTVEQMAAVEDVIYDAK